MNKNALVLSIPKSLFFLWIGHFFMDFFTGIWPIYKTIAEIDIAKAGMIAGISGFMGEILQVFFGYFCDRGHRKKILLLGLALASSIVWVTFVDGIFSCFVLLLLMMLGSGCFHPAAAGMAGNLSKNKRGGVILLFASGGSIGLGISQLVFTKLFYHFDGHALLVLLPLALVLFAIFFHPFHGQTFTPSNTSFKTFLTPLMQCHKPLLLLYFAQVINQAIALAFIFLLPDLLRARECHTWLCMGGGHLCYILSSALTLVPAAYLCQRYGQKSVLITVVSFTTILFYFFLSQDVLSLGESILILCLLGGMFGLINPIIVSWGNRLVPESPSTVSALLMGFAWCLSNLGPTCAGFITRLFSENVYINTLAAMGLGLVIVLFLIFLMPRHVITTELVEEKTSIAIAEETPE